MKIKFDWHEINSLIALLNAQGVHYLIGSEEPANEPIEEIEPVRLIQRLAACGYPLVRDASISLFILHPELASAIAEALQSSEPDVAEELAVVTLATLYMQHWWLFRLTFALGRLPSFPEEPFVALWEERGLPSPRSGYGLNGLLGLQEYQQRRYNAPLTFLGDWQNQIDHLLAQEEAHQRTFPEELKETLVQFSKEKAETVICVRQQLEQQIEQFLVQVGRTQQPGRLYITGGAALVHRGIRAGRTLDIDIQITIDPANLMTQIVQLKQKMNINIEFSSPGDFMPLPQDWEARSEFVNRYGQVDVFYFDWYSIALSKMQRGNQRDVADVQLLVEQKFVGVRELDLLYQDVLNKIGNPPYDRLLPNLTQQQFSQHYQAVRQLL